MNKEISPPASFLRFFRWFCHPSLLNSIEGDLMELYHERLKLIGKRKADLKFIVDVLLLVRPGIIRPSKGYYSLNNYDMFKNYFKIAWRNLLRSKVYSTINISGLAAGMTVALMIGLWILDETTFDSSFENHERLGQVLLNQKGFNHDDQWYTNGAIAMPLGETLEKEYTADFKAVSLTSWNEEHSIGTSDRVFTSTGMWVQEKFPEMTTLPMRQGSRNVLKNSSATMAKIIFGNEDPMNKPISIDRKIDLVVSGVFEDFPHNTTFFDTQFLLPWDNDGNVRKPLTGWNDHSGLLFVELNQSAQWDATAEKIKSIPTPHIKDWQEECLLYPLDKLHLYSFENGKMTAGTLQFVWLMGTIGTFVLLLACINFMNLSTARSERRSREVGIRKAVGSVRSQLIGQFLVESIATSMIALVLSLILAEVCLPFFNSITGKQLTMPWGEPVFWLSVFGFALMTGVVSGSYPAFYLSGFKPIKVLRGSFKIGRLASLPRRGLVVVQFTVSITIVICTVFILLQVQYAKDRVPGFSRAGLVSVKLNSPTLREHYDVIKNELLSQNLIVAATRSSQSPANFNNNTGLEWTGKDAELVVFFRDVYVAPNYGQTIGWKIKAGRDFSPDLPGDTTAMIVNEKTAKIMGFKQPLGERIKCRGRDYTIIGITEDMVTQSPYEPVLPVVFLSDKQKRLMITRLNPDKSTAESLAGIEKIFKSTDPASPFSYNFVDEEYGRKFSNEERIGNLTGFFAVLAIFISCLGLFGLSSFVAQQRVKEIGIRKVLGASVYSLWRMLSTDFVRLMLIASVIAVASSYSFMSDWLSKFPYRTQLNWQVFALTVAVTMMVMLITVSFQTIRASTMDPVKSLKSE